MDTSLSQRTVLDAERTASYAFLDHMLREGKDRAFLIHFDYEVELLQDLTASREKLKSALALLQTPSQNQDDEEGSPDEHRGRGTLLYERNLPGANELMKKQQGRKAIVVLTRWSGPWQQRNSGRSRGAWVTWRREKGIVD